MEVSEPLVAEMLLRSDTRQAAVESNNGGRGFARAVQSLSPGVRIEWFHQGGNKEARILSNSATALHLLRWPRGWNFRWPELYAPPFSRQPLARCRRRGDGHRRTRSRRPQPEPRAGRAVSVGRDRVFAA